MDGAEYLVSPYGEVGWVHNVRANPDASLSRRSRQRQVRLVEVQGAEAARVTAAYHARERYARGYMDVPADPTVEDFERAAALFPVFRVTAG